MARRHSFLLAAGLFLGTVLDTMGADVNKVEVDLLGGGLQTKSARQWIKALLDPRLTNLAPKAAMPTDGHRNAMKVIFAVRKNQDLKGKEKDNIAETFTEMMKDSLNQIKAGDLYGTDDDVAKKKVRLLNHAYFCVMFDQLAHRLLNVQNNGVYESFVKSLEGNFTKRKELLENVKENFGKSMGAFDNLATFIQKRIKEEGRAPEVRWIEESKKTAQDVIEGYQQDYSKYDLDRLKGEPGDFKGRFKAIMIGEGAQSNPEMALPFIYSIGIPFAHTPASMKKVLSYLDDLRLTPYYLQERKKGKNNKESYESALDQYAQKLDSTKVEETKALIKAKKLYEALDSTNETGKGNLKLEDLKRYFLNKGNESTIKDMALNLKVDQAKLKDKVDQIVGHLDTIQIDTSLAIHGTLPHVQNGESVLGQFFENYRTSLQETSPDHLRDIPDPSSREKKWVEFFFEKLSMYKFADSLNDFVKKDADFENIRFEQVIDVDFLNQMKVQNSLIHQELSGVQKFFRDLQTNATFVDNKDFSASGGPLARQSDKINELSEKSKKWTPLDKAYHMLTALNFRNHDLISKATEPMKKLKKAMDTYTTKDLPKMGNLQERWKYFSLRDKLKYLNLDKSDESQLTKVAELIDYAVGCLADFDIELGIDDYLKVEQRVIDTIAAYGWIHFEEPKKS